MENKIPLIILNYNQLTYLRNMINWWQFYNPGHPVFIVDNGSDSKDLRIYYNETDHLSPNGIKVYRYANNTCIPNLTNFIETEIKGKYDYYCISDPDIMIHPATPPNFLEVFQMYIEEKGYHHVGFNLIIDDLPEWLEKRAWIQGNENELLNNPKEKYGEFTGYKAPIDTTFAMYTTKNSGWHAPMDGQSWSNALRIFKAFHLGWYIHPDHVNSEMDYYFRTSTSHKAGEPSAGRNNNRPNKYIK